MVVTYTITTSADLSQKLINQITNIIGFIYWGITQAYIDVVVTSSSSIPVADAIKTTIVVDISAPVSYVAPTITTITALIDSAEVVAYITARQTYFISHHVYTNVDQTFCDQANAIIQMIYFNATGIHLTTRLLGDITSPNNAVVEIVDPVPVTQFPFPTMIEIVDQYNSAALLTYRASRRLALHGTVTYNGDVRAVLRNYFYATSAVNAVERRFPTQFDYNTELDHNQTLVNAISGWTLPDAATLTAFVASPTHAALETYYSQYLDFNTTPQTTREVFYVLVRRIDEMARILYPANSTSMEPLPPTPATTFEAGKEWLKVELSRL